MEIGIINITKIQTIIGCKALLYSNTKTGCSSTPIADLLFCLSDVNLYVKYLKKDASMVADRSIVRGRNIVIPKVEVIDLSPLDYKLPDNAFYE